MSLNVESGRFFLALNSWVSFVVGVVVVIVATSGVIIVVGVAMVVVRAFNSCVSMYEATTSEEKTL